MGPHMEQTGPVAAALTKAGALIVVKNGAEVFAQCARWEDDAGLRRRAGGAARLVLHAEEGLARRRMLSPASFSRRRNSFLPLSLPVLCMDALTASGSRSQRLSSAISAGVRMPAWRLSDTTSCTKSMIELA